MNMDEPAIDSEGLGGVRLLSFDGGDIRAVSQLIILDEFMRRIEEERESTTRILPCDYFHMIGGVGASGIIVILLTVLRMGIEETIEEFIRIWNQVFADVTLDQSARSAKLDVLIKDLLKSRGLDESRRMHNGDQVDNSCKAFVCAIPESNLGICEKFRTYKSKETSLNPTIVEAIRATCAVPTLFLPVGIQSVGCQVSYVSGAYNFNNPAAETIKEACQYFGRDQRVACMLSLGGGQRAISYLNQANEMKVMSLVKDFACDCERVDRDLGWRIGESNVYYRLSVNQILDASGTEAINNIGDITSCTKGFLDHHETASKINKCVQASESIGGVTLRDISGLNEPRPTSVHGLPSLSEFFVERPALMKAMAQRLFQLGPSTQRRMVLSGLGGIGKTQITIRFLLRYLARFRHILFIDGSSEQSIESGLVAKVKSLGATYSRSSASEALEVLSNPDYEITRNWAIIYDNVDNPEINIGRYFPGCAFGTIIITTRNPNVGILASRAHLKLDAMSGEEAAELLLRTAIDPSREPTDIEREEVHEITKELGYLPVALVQAGYFIRIHDCMGKYRERLRNRRPDILGRPAEYHLDPHDGLYGALNLTWPHLTSGAQHFMSILGFVNYTGFPIILLYRAAAHKFSFESFHLTDRSTLFQETIQLLCDTFHPKKVWDEQDVDDLVAELEKYSLVTRMITFKVTTLRLHPLVHSWTRDRLSLEEKERYHEAAVRLLVCGTGSDDEDIYEFIYPHVSGMSDRLEKLHTNDRAGVAMILAHQGDLRAAIRLWEVIQGTVRMLYERNDLRSSEADLRLAGLYWCYARFQAARLLEGEVVQVRKLSQGPYHPKTLEASVQRARHMAEEYASREGAKEILRGVLDAWGGQRSDNLEAFLQTKETLAHFCGRIESIGLYTEIMQTRMEQNGPDHHATLKVMEILAKKYHKPGLFEAGEEANRREYATNIWVSVVAARTSRRGREHPDTLDAMENLAGSYAFQNMPGKAAKQWQEVIHLRKAVQGADHEDTLRTMTALAGLYKKTGQYTKAILQWKEIIHLNKQVDYSGQVKTLQAVRELASTFEKAGQPNEVVIQWKEIVHLTQQIHGPSNDKTLEDMRKLAKVYETAEQYTEAEMQWKQILHLTRQRQGPSHENTLNVMGKLAWVYRKTKQYTNAETQWKEIARVMKEAHGLSHTNRLEAMIELAMGYTISQQYAKAEAQWKEIVRLAEEAHGSKFQYVSGFMGQMAKMYRTQGRYEDAAAVLINARKYRRIFRRRDA